MATQLAPLPTENAHTAHPPAAKRTSFGIFVRLLCAAVVLLIAGELFCRYVIGLGDPPLYVADPKMEYLLQPSKTYYRFHKRFAVNQYGMRSDDFPPQKSDANEFRVLVIGDSVIYGGVRIDQSDIDTEILKRSLQQQLGRPVVVGNASAKSWGPPNELAYLQRFGTLQADVVILELSSHDYADAPTFAPVVGIAAAYPDKKPSLALTDLLKTYLLPRYLHIGDTAEGVDRTLPDAPASSQDIAECREAEREFFRFVRSHNAKVALIQHFSRPEVNGDYQVGYYANQAVAKEEKVPFVDDDSELRDSLQHGQDPFNTGDPLHLNTIGQGILAHSLQTAVDLALKEK
jgi:GDSL-like Lipase/Acylhydrolase family